MVGVRGAGRGWLGLVPLALAAALFLAVAPVAVLVTFFASGAALVSPLNGLLAVALSLIVHLLVLQAAPAILEAPRWVAVISRERRAERAARRTEGKRDRLLARTRQTVARLAEVDQAAQAKRIARRGIEASAGHIGRLAERVVARTGAPLDQVRPTLDALLSPAL